VVALHFFTKPVAAYLSERIDEVGVTFKQVEVLRLKPEYLSTPFTFWLYGLRGSRFHGELELVVVMVTIVFAGDGHLCTQQCSECAKREKEGSTQQSTRFGG